MSFDSDVVLIGTGVAPLVAAGKLLAEGKSVLLLNPEWDFFGEDSELPLDPFWPPTPETLNPQRLARSQMEWALRELRPHYPGAIEAWPNSTSTDKGFRDPFAPHVRSRSRLWVQSAEMKTWETIEDMYVESSDAGLNPQILEGIVALRKFPGYASKTQVMEDLRGVLIPKVTDVDVSRFRNGLLEFIRERLGQERVVCAASQIDIIPEGIRFHAGGAPKTARIREGLLVFWTARLTQWVQAQSKRAEAETILPRGIRLWEEWSLVSRETLDPGIVGMFEEMAVWAEVEGAPEDPQLSQLNRLSVLRAGPLVGIEAASSMNAPGLGMTWASGDSFRALSRLCHDFLNWDRFSVRSVRPRAILEWGREAVAKGMFSLPSSDWKAHVVCGCDGPITEVVYTARKACERLLGGGDAK